MTSHNPSWVKMRERGGGMLFALGLNALLLLALLTLAPHPEPREGDPRYPVSFSLAPQQEAKKAEAQKSKKRERREEKQEKQEKRVEQKEPAPVPAVRPPRPIVKAVENVKLPFLVMDSAQMASADIARLPAREPAQNAGGGGQSAAGPGEGPGGVQLFEAEWYRRPSHAELATYIPANAPTSGWGLVACKTVDDFRVENCQALGESPVGSGFARAVRLAAWQFLVRPPRVNGKPMVGSWVRIRIDYSQASGGAG